MTDQPNIESMQELEAHWDATANSEDGWVKSAPHILSNEEAHIFVEGVMVIAKRSGWLGQDKSIFDWLKERLGTSA